MNIPGMWRLKQTQKLLNVRGAALMYHRVAQLEQDPWQINVSPKHFAEQMQVLKKYAKPVQTRTMERGLKTFSLGKKEIAVTFDDGYVDNFHNAKPILEQHEVPATFFIVSNAIGKKEEFWWDELERIILLAKTLPQQFQMNIGNKEYQWTVKTEIKQEVSNGSPLTEPANGTVLFKNQLYTALWKVLSNFSQEEKKLFLQQIAKWSGQGPIPRSNYFPMTLDELQSMAHSKLFEIGAHTVYHPMLTNLPPNKQEEEIKNSKNELEGMLNQTITSFAYPHGKYSNETIAILKRLKFKAAVTVNQGLVMKNHDPYLLPRFMPLDWDGDEFERNLQKWLKPLG